MKLLICVLLFLFSTALFSQGLFETAVIEDQNKSKELKLEFSGYARGSVFAGFNKYDFSSVFGEIGFTGKLKHKQAFMFADIRMREGYSFNEPISEVQLKEVFAGFSGEKIDLFLGNQIVEWGRTDGFNPTNCITPNDYFFLSSEPDDQKLSNFMFRIKYHISTEIELELIAIPIYKSSIYWYKSFDLGYAMNFTDMVLPDKSFDNSSIAARLNFELPKIGFSFSWFRGYNPDFGFNVENIDWSTGEPDITNASTPYFKNMIGADMALPLGSWIIRVEVAYNITDNYKNKMYVPNPDLSYVAGIELNFGEFNTILQYVGKYTFDFSELTAPVLTEPTDPTAQLQYANELIYYESSLFNRKHFYQQKKNNHALLFTISKPFAYETWNTEFAVYYNFTSEEYMLRSKISWDISDILTASTGFSYMAGPEKEMFNYAGSVLNGGFFELKVSF